MLSEQLSNSRIFGLEAPQRPGQTIRVGRERSGELAYLVASAARRPADVTKSVWGDPGRSGVEESKSTDSRENESKKRGRLDSILGWSQAEVSRKAFSRKI